MCPSFSLSLFYSLNQRDRKCRKALQGNIYSDICLNELISISRSSFLIRTSARAVEALCPPSATVRTAVGGILSAGRRRTGSQSPSSRPPERGACGSRLALPAPWSRLSARASLTEPRRTGVSGSCERAAADRGVLPPDAHLWRQVWANSAPGAGARPSLPSAVLRGGVSPNPSVSARVTASVKCCLIGIIIVFQRFRWESTRWSLCGAGKGVGKKQRAGGL